MKTHRTVRAPFGDSVTIVIEDSWQDEAERWREGGIDENFHEEAKKIEQLLRVSLPCDLYDALFDAMRECMEGTSDD